MGCLCQKNQCVLGKGHSWMPLRILLVLGKRFWNNCTVWRNSLPHWKFGRFYSQRQVSCWLSYNNWRKHIKCGWGQSFLLLLWQGIVFVIWNFEARKGILIKTLWSISDIHRFCSCPNIQGLIRSMYNYKSVEKTNKQTKW